MARKKMLRRLSRLPAARLVARTEHKTERLIETLRAAALRNQREEPRTFYAMREVSAHFHVSFAIVARAYHRLEQEGLLTRMRGSRTRLQGRRFDRQLAVRAVIALPASLSAFVTSQAYRMFFIAIRRELRLRGFATAMVFFEPHEAKSAALSQRLKSYEVDTVLWFQPPRQARETVLRLTDSGVRLIGVAHEQVASIPCRYHVSREHGIRVLLAEWRRVGIRHVTVAQWSEYRTPALEEALHSALRENELTTSSVTFHGQRSETFLRALRKVKSSAIAFSSGHLASRLCFRVPKTVTGLLEHHRVAFLNGPVSMPFAKVPDAQVDLIVADWTRISEQIADDLVTQDAFQFSGPTMFEAEVKLRAPLRDFAQAI